MNTKGFSESKIAYSQFYLAGDIGLLASITQVRYKDLSRKLHDQFLAGCTEQLFLLLLKLA